MSKNDLKITKEMLDKALEEARAAGLDVDQIPEDFLDSMIGTDIGTLANNAVSAFDREVERNGIEVLMRATVGPDGHVSAIPVINIMGRYVTPHQLPDDLPFLDQIKAMVIVATEASEALLKIGNKLQSKTK